MRAARIAIVVVLAAGVGVVAWWRLRGGECERFAQKVCAFAPNTCGDVKVAFQAVRLGAGQCRQGNELLAAAEAQPEGLRGALATAAFAETVGAEEAFRATRDTMMMMMDVDFAVDQGRSPDDLLKRLRAIGPPACSALAARLSSDDPKRRALAHGLLVDIRGQDLGADPEAWRPWCIEVFKASLKPK